MKTTITDYEKSLGYITTDELTVDDFETAVLDPSTFAFKNIESWFKDECEFDCGQGYYTDECELLVKMDNNFYSLFFCGEIGSKKMDVGDRVYYIEWDTIFLSSVTKLEKPIKPIPFDVKLNFTLTKEQYNSLLHFCKTNNITVKNEIEIH